MSTGNRTERTGGAPAANRGRGRRWGLVLAVTLGAGAFLPGRAERFEGIGFAGEGDVEYVKLLDLAWRMFVPDPEFQNMAMLYTPQWNGLVEGPTWGAWWVQNSYGTSYAALPFYEEPFVTFLQNSQDLWYDHMGDGKTSYVWNGKDSWVPPDGCLMDAASDTWAMHRQGDGRVAIHDWGIEFTAAGGLLQSELLLIGRDPAAVGRYLPKLERAANLVESRRDTDRNLFLAGPAGNLLAPSYAGFRRPDGSYDKAFLAGLSVTYIAFLDRLIELEKLMGRTAEAGQLAVRRDSARLGLARVTTPEGYLVKSMDPDGTLHGVYGAARHGYFEASPNHDAICFRVVGDAQARRILGRMTSIPGLRPHDLIVANCPSLDDMYEEPKGLWGFGTWVNGGHWTTCEARMMMAYLRLGAFADARRSMEQILRFARQFRMDNPLVDFGGAVYQPGEPINITYDAFGAPAGLIRGLYEYLYRADELTLIPHLPDGIARLEQKFPIRFGSKRLYLATAGHGPIRSVRVNGRAWRDFDAAAVHLRPGNLPDVAAIEIVAGEGASRRWTAPRVRHSIPALPGAKAWPAPGEPTLIAPTDLPLRLGADSDGGSRFTGEIARAAVFERSLSPAEIAALAQGDTNALLRDPALSGCWFPGSASAGIVANRAGRAPDARVVGNAEVAESAFGPVLRLSGEGYLEVTNHPALNLARGGTWYVLVRPGATKGRLIDKCPVGGATGYTFDLYPGNALRLITDAGTISTNAALPADRWVHLAATVSDKSELTLYVDGRAVASQHGTRSGGVDLASVVDRVRRVRRFAVALERAGLGSAPEAAHARLAVRCLVVARERTERLAAGRLVRLPERSQRAADQLYLATVGRLTDGLVKSLEKPGPATPERERLRKLWVASADDGR